ncbi:MAG: DegV family EDD domain-containing protein [Gammaproteobacteria bacterium]|nr:DegV family protein [Gammaproteobacteria bacterium]NNC96841.1 DegV family EDD domain-containing protein [Gammaproteobacteria bacterium]NNM14557.1 DegV family EDD domain-containing protein [Gammaproteobacteria bacterium]
MRIGVVICSSADLPRSFIEANDLNIMPISLKFKDDVFVDDRDPVATQEYYRRYLIDKDMDAETAPFSVEQIKDWFLDELVLKYDRVLVLSLMSSRSPIYDNAMKASFAILRGYRQKRREAGVKGSFSLRVIDTKCLFTAEAAIAHEAVRLIREEKVGFDKLRPQIEELTKHAHGFLVPNDLYYLRNVARKKGDKSLGLMKYLLAKGLDIKPIMCAHNGETFAHDKGKGFDETVSKLFEQTKDAIDRGLRVPLVCMSYAGDPNVIKAREDYIDFVQHAENYGIHHTMAVMSTTAGVNLGPGAFSLGYITQD